MNSRELIEWGVTQGLIKRPELSSEKRESQALLRKYYECRERSRIARREKARLAAAQIKAP